MMASRRASAAESEQVAELLEVARLRRARIEVVEEAEAGQHGRIDAVVFGELADGFGEAPGAQGVDKHGFETGLGEALVEVAVVAPSGFEDGPGDAVLEQPVAQCAAAGLVVVELAIESAVEDVGVEFRLAHINASDYDGVGIGHSCFPVLLQFGAFPTLPFRARRNGCDPCWQGEESAISRSGGLRHLRRERPRHQRVVLPLRHLSNIRGEHVSSVSGADRPPKTREIQATYGTPEGIYGMVRSRSAAVASSIMLAPAACNARWP